MSNRTRASSPHRLAVVATVSALLGLGTVAPGVQAAGGSVQAGTEAPLLVAGTVGSERRQENREDIKEGLGVSMPAPVSVRADSPAQERRLERLCLVGISTRCCVNDRERLASIICGTYRNTNYNGIVGHPE
jgi:hypothetical protein